MKIDKSVHQSIACVRLYVCMCAHVYTCAHTHMDARTHNQFQLWIPGVNSSKPLLPSSTDPKLTELRVAVISGEAKGLPVLSQSSLGLSGKEQLSSVKAVGLESEAIKSFLGSALFLLSHPKNAPSHSVWLGFPLSAIRKALCP